MGEVYRARDTRLGRTVAVKVLPESVSRSAEHRQRFEREARAIAALNHPNICTLHDVGRSGETDFLVMELVEGETLSARVRKGPLPPADVIRIGIEIASALARAHRAGILHRDLKPGNVMLTKTGAKLMDFGLARLHVMEVGPLGASQSPTQSAPITGEGRIVGTYQYMAPEQLEGREVDARSDLWALGATLYEMATGRRAFDGTSTASVISAIMREEPRPITELAPMSPPGLDRLVRTCLAKDPDARWQNAADLARELQWVAASEHVGGVEPGVTLTKAGVRTRWAAGSAATLFLLMGALAISAGSAWQRSRERRPMQTKITFPAGTMDFVPGTSLALAPDGSAIAMTMPDSAGIFRLYVRKLSELEPIRLDTPHSAELPFWSPDSKEIAFWTDEDKLVRMPATGGPQRTICDAHDFAGGSWSRKGGIVFAPGGGLHGIVHVSEAGGSTVPVTRIDSAAHEASHTFPAFLPDGKHFVYVVTYAETLTHFRIRVGSLEGGPNHDLLTTNGAARVSSDGTIVYVPDRVIYVQKVDAHGTRLIGAPQALPGVPEQRTIFSSEDPAAVVSPHLVIYPMVDPRPTEYWSYSLAGVPENRLATLTGPFYYAVPSPDGRRAITMYAAGAETNIWSLIFASGVSTRLTPPPWKSRQPYWLPDSRRIIFEYWGPDGHQVRLIGVDDPNSSELLFRIRGEGEPTAVLGDARAVLLGRSGTSRDVMIAERDSAWNVRPYAASDADEWGGTFCGDGHWVAYATQAVGRVQIVADSYPVQGHRTVLTREPIGFPMATRRFWVAGNKLLYVLEDGRTLREATLSFVGGAIAAGAPHTLFVLPQDCRGVGPAADGSHILVETPVGPRQAPTLAVLQNWDLLDKKQ